MGPQQAAPEATFPPLDGSRGPIYGRGPLEVLGGVGVCPLAALFPHFPGPPIFDLFTIDPLLSLGAFLQAGPPRFHHRMKRRQVPYKVLQSLKANPSFSSICMFLSVYIYLLTKSSRGQLSLRLQHPAQSPALSRCSSYDFCHSLRT